MSLPEIDTKNRASGIVAIGMGPGDPELLTMKAVKLWHRAAAIYTLRPEGRERSRCGEIAAAAGLDLTKLREVAYRPVPGGDKDRWHPYLDEIRAVIAGSGLVGFATIGDPSIYSGWPAFSRFVAENIPDCPVTVVPGIPAALAAAATLNFPLVQRRESLQLMPMPRNAKGLIVAIEAAAEKGCTYAWYKAEGRTKEVAEILRKYPECSLSWIANIGEAGERRGTIDDLAEQDGTMMVILVKIGK